MEHILKWFTGVCDKSQSYLNWFSLTFDPSDFHGIDAVFMCFIKYCAKLNILAKTSYLETYLELDGMRDVKRYNIKETDNDTYDYEQLSQLMEAYEVIKQSCILAYDKYMMEDLTDRDFKVDMNTFMSKMKKDMVLSSIMASVKEISADGDVDISSDKLRSDILKIQKKYNIESLSDIDITQEDLSKDVIMETVTETGIPCLDKDAGGILTHMMYTLAAPPGAGKTQFTLAQFVYRVLTEAKKDVVFYELEMTKTQIKNILLSIHIAHKFSKVKIPFSSMNTGRLSEEQRRYVEMAKADLFESGNYGKLTIHDECIAETLEDDLELYLNSNPDIKLVCIDYMGLIDSKPLSKYDKRLDGYEVITEGYKVVRRLLKKYDFAAVCINQFNDKGIEAATTGKEIKSGHIQGGHITHRHTDYDIALTCTATEKEAGFRFLSTTKTRGSKGIQNQRLKVDLSIALFMQEVD